MSVHISKAISLYTEAIALLKQQTVLAPDHKRQVLNMYLSMYEASLQTLHDIEDQSSQSKSNDTKEAREYDVGESDEQEEFFIIEDPFEILDMNLKVDSMGDQNQLPEEQVLRPFYFMRKLQRSISEGAFITKGLFVPKQVWYQKTAQIADIERKLMLFGELRRELRYASEEPNWQGIDVLVNFIVRT
jgi:hypothetical protein